MFLFVAVNDSLINVMAVMLLGLLWAVSCRGRGRSLVAIGSVMALAWIGVTACQLSSLSDERRMQLLVVACGLVVGGILDILLQRLVGTWSVPRDRESK